MIHHELLEDDGILVVSPAGKLEASDFTALAAEVDPFIESHGALRGLLIHTESFPGWDSFAALLSHLRFVRNHHHAIRRVAAVTDSAFLSIVPKVAVHFVGAKIRHFEFSAKAEALAWLKSD